MNWLDWVLLAVLALAAFRGFRNGSIIELSALAGVLLGIWGASHFSGHVAAWLGWSADRSVLAFIVTALGVMVLVALLARALTTAIDIAQLSLPNKVAGIAFGLMRTAFMASVALNVLPATTWGAKALPADVREGSLLEAPVRAFAPVIVPQVAESKWVKRTIEQVKAEGEQLME